jgi:N-acetyl-gamma-glutamyl-phosphate reductase
VSSDSVKRVGLVGATGYTGMELARLLAGHPEMELVRATSRARAGERLGDLYPFLRGTGPGRVEMTAPDPGQLAADCDLVFLAVPHGTAMDMAGALVDAGTRVVDLSADFRLRDAEVYESWYGLAHRRTDLFADAVYGLCELYEDDIRTAPLVANPGCYPTSCILALYPALKLGLAKTSGLLVDAKSGTSGAGRKPSEATLFCEVHDTFRAYSLGRHRHTPEIEQELGRGAGSGLTISFNPHLVPMNRGILATCYAQAAPDATQDKILDAYREFYDPKPWVRVMPDGELPQTRWVRGSMFCDLGLVLDERTGKLIIVSVIDNLCRGASGQALVNANLMLGLDAGLGIPPAPMAP